MVLRSLAINEQRLRALGDRTPTGVPATARTATSTPPSRCGRVPGRIGNRRERPTQDPIRSSAQSDRSATPMTTPSPRASSTPSRPS